MPRIMKAITWYWLHTILQNVLGPTPSQQVLELKLNSANGENDVCPDAKPMERTTAIWVWQLVCPDTKPTQKHTNMGIQRQLHTLRYTPATNNRSRSMTSPFVAWHSGHIHRRRTLKTKNLITRNIEEAFQCSQESCHTIKDTGEGADIDARYVNGANVAVKSPTVKPVRCGIIQLALNQIVPMFPGSMMTCGKPCATIHIEYWIKRPEVLYYIPPVLVAPYVAALLKHNGILQLLSCFSLCSKGIALG